MTHIVLVDISNMLCPIDCIGYLHTQESWILCANDSFDILLQSFLDTFWAMNASLSVSTRGRYKPIALVYSACYTRWLIRKEISASISRHSLLHCMISFEDPMFCSFNDIKHDFPERIISKTYFAFGSAWKLMLMFPELYF